MEGSVPLEVPAESPKSLEPTKVHTFNEAGSIVLATDDEQ